MSGLASAAVLNIRSSRKLTISDLKNVFAGMPSNFRSCFMRNILQKGLNHPGCILYIDLAVDKN